VLLFLIILPGAVHILDFRFRILDLMTDQIAEHQLPAVSIRNPKSKIKMTP
jgi:hypothetical protein